MEVHAVLGTLSMIWKMLGRAQADPIDYAAAVFDSPGKTFRYELFASYKAKRVRQAGLVPQIKMLRQAVRTLGMEPLEHEGFEADDVIATLCSRAKMQGIRTTVVGIDKDLMQLVEDDVIEIVDPVNRVRILAADVEKKFGVPPSLMPDLQALAGDAVDGIPGVPGIGYKKAAKLIREYGSLRSSTGAPVATWAKLTEDHKSLALYLELVTLRRDVPISIDFEDLKPREIKRSHLEEMLRVLEAEDQFTNLFGGDQRFLRPVEKASIDPFMWWRSALAGYPGALKPLVPQEPQCGFYKRRLVKGGPEVACRIWREADYDMNNLPTGKDVLMCEVAGELADPVSQWGYLASNPIPESDYRHMMELAKWSRDHAKEDPLADPKEPVDWMKTPTPF